MKTNVGGFDGMLRSLLFVLALCFGVMTGSWWLTIPTAILFVTAMIKWCPLYDMFDINTNKETAKS
jgi:hypothetical protein